MKALTLGVAAAVMLSGCSESDEKPLGASAPELLVDGGSDPHLDTQLSALERTSLDVLFVIDNSGSMANKQLKLAAQIPRMIDVLTTGDHGRFTPVSSLHVGLVTTNFGGTPADGLPPNSPPQLQSCAGTGDQGVLQNSLTFATGGITAQYDNEFPGAKKGQIILPSDPTCELGAQPTYQSLEAGTDASAAAKAFSCEARVGVRGCPFEQPLESMWAALAPSTGSGELYTFLGGTRGNGDRANSGFVRPNAALAVVVLTDEEDCSVTQAASDLNSYRPDVEAKYGPADDINMRCYRSADDPALLNAVTRYRDGLLSLKPGHQDRVAFTVIAGLPLDASTRSLDSLLADPRMQASADPEHPGFPSVVCANPNASSEVAFPSRRLLETAKLFPNAVVESICKDDFAPAINATVDKIAPMMGP